MCYTIQYYLLTKAYEHTKREMFHYIAIGMNDLTSSNQSLVISTGQFEACFQLLANEDDIVESDEAFTVMAEAIYPSDEVNGSVSVLISDNDGRLCIVSSLNK